MERSSCFYFEVKRRQSRNNEGCIYYGFAKGGTGTAYSLRLKANRYSLLAANKEISATHLLHHQIP